MTYRINEITGSKAFRESAKTQSMVNTMMYLHKLHTLSGARISTLEGHQMVISVMEDALRVLESSEAVAGVNYDGTIEIEGIWYPVLVTISMNRKTEEVRATFQMKH